MQTKLVILQTIFKNYLFMKIILFRSFINRKIYGLLHIIFAAVRVETLAGFATGERGGRGLKVKST
jgi:hypothetical protein